MIIEEFKDLHIKISEELLVREELLEQEFDAFFEGVKVPEKAMV